MTEDESVAAADEAAKAAEEAQDAAELLAVFHALSGLGVPESPPDDIEGIGVFGHPWRRSK